MGKAISQCRDKTLPEETVSIHLKDYSLKFFVGNSHSSLPLIAKTEKGVILIKLYLLKREQVEDLIKQETGVITDISWAIEKDELDYTFPILGSQSLYDCLVNVGQLDELPIFTFSR
jgi:hypothetical protein